METVSGKRKGSVIYIHNGYAYNIDRRIMNTYRCSTRRTTGCSAVAKVLDNGEVCVKNVHTHPPDDEKRETRVLQDEMLRLSRETVLPLKDIFDNVCRTNPQAAARISYNSMKSPLTRERSKCKPPIPHTFQNLADALSNYKEVKDTYKGNVVAEDGSMAVIFSSNKLIDALNSTTEIFVDGTFSVVPRNPQMIQLYSVHIRYKNTGIATIFALCESRTCALYEAMWKKIVELAPDLQSNVKFIMGDYEKAAIKVLHNYFPEANIHGCWFHFNQAVLRKWRQLDLKNSSKKLILMVMSLPLVPDTSFEEAFKILHNIADETYEDDSKILQFLAYLRKTWLPIADKVSVFDCAIRTNNIVESFHNSVSRKLNNNHPNMWIFIDNLKKVIVDQEIDLSRLHNNIRARRPRTRINRERNNTISQKQNDLLQQRLTLSEFLLSFTDFNDKLYFSHSQINEDNDVSDEPEVCAEFLSSSSAEYAENKRKSKENRRSTTSNSYNGCDNATILSNIESTTVTRETTVLTRSAVHEDRNITNLQQPSDDDIYSVPFDDFGYVTADLQTSNLNIPFKRVERPSLTASENEKDKKNICVAPA